MPANQSPLSFAVLRHANILRLPLFKNARGEPAHSEPDGSDWSYNDWLTAFLGELGETANLAKKFRRGDQTYDDLRATLANEFADTFIYADLCHYQMKLGGTLFEDNLLDFDHLQSYAKRRDGTSKNAVNDYLTRAFGAFGYAARLVERSPNFVEGSPTVNDCWMEGMVALASACNLLHIRLSDAIVEKFNVVSERVGANVYICRVHPFTAGDFVANAEGTKL